jgi:sugar phosphate isomerase/epimerase
MTVQDRRSFLATLGGGALAIAGCTRPMLVGSPAAATRRLRTIGIQLYTVRRQAMADLPGTIAQIGKIGLKEIEFWGSFKQTPAEIRRMLDDSGMTSPSVHIGLPTGDAGYGPIFDSAKTMGQQWIVAASPPFTPKNVDEWKRMAGVFNDVGRRVHDAGFRFAFHNHTEASKKIGDVLPFDILLAESDPALVSYELDVHWAYAGGADAVSLLREHPTRFRMLHIKDSSGPPDYKQTDVGAGTYPWPTILDAASRAGIEHYFIEHDGPADPFAFAKSGYDYLSHLEF